MMRTPNTIEDEIDEIRLRIYERTKHMTHSERTEYYRKSGEATAKKYGFKLINNPIEKKVVFDGTQAH